jgi:hypothetical protein
MAERTRGEQGPINCGRLSSGGRMAGARTHGRAHGPILCSSVVTAGSENFW